MRARSRNVGSDSLSVLHFSLWEGIGLFSLQRVCEGTEALARALRKKPQDCLGQMCREVWVASYGGFFLKKWYGDNWAIAVDL